MISTGYLAPGTSGPREAWSYSGPEEPRYQDPQPIQSGVRGVGGGNASPLGRPIPTGYGVVVRTGDPVIDPKHLGGYRVEGDGISRPQKTLVNLVYCLLDTQLGGVYSLLWARANKDFIIRTAEPVRTINSPYRFYGGDQTTVDPVIEEFLDEEFRTMWPGFCYIVLEDFDIAPYDNQVPVFDFQIGSTIDSVPASEEQSTLIFDNYHPDAFNYPFAVDMSRGLHYQAVLVNDGQHWLTTVRIDTLQEIARVQITSDMPYAFFENMVALDGTNYIVGSVATIYDGVNQWQELALLRISDGVIVARIPVQFDEFDQPYEPAPRCSINMQAPGATKFLVFSLYNYSGINHGAAYTSAAIVDIAAESIAWVIHPYSLPALIGGFSSNISGYSMCFGAVSAGTVDLFWTDSVNASSRMIALAKVSYDGTFTVGTAYSASGAWTGDPGVAFDYTDGGIVVYNNSILTKIMPSGTIAYSTNTGITNFNFNMWNHAYQGFFYRARPGWTIATRGPIYGDIYQVNLDNGSYSLLIDPDNFSDYDIFKYYDQYTSTMTEGSAQAGIINRITLGDSTPNQVDLADIMLALGTFDGRHEASDFTFTGFPGNECYGVLYEQDTSIQDALRTLREPFDISSVESDGKVKFRYPPRDDSFVADLVLTTPSKFVDQGQFTFEKVIEAEQEALWACEISFFDIDNYGERGTPAYYARPKGAYDVTRSIDRRGLNLPLFMTSARVLEQAALVVYRSVYALEYYQGILGPELAYLEPGDIITFPFRNFTVTAQIKEATLNADYTQTVMLVQYLQAHDATYTGAEVIVPPITGLAFNWVLPVPSGSYLITGGEAGLLRSSLRAVFAESGIYVLTGTEASLSIGSARLVASGTSYFISGKAATLFHDLIAFNLAANAGSYTLTGGSVGFPIGGTGGDPYFAYVVLLVGFDGADASTTFTDESAAAHPLTVTNQAQVDTAQSVFGGASALFDGANDGIFSVDSDDWTLSSANSDAFTVECWIRRSTAGVTQMIVGQRVSSTQSGAGNAWALVASSSNQLVWQSSSLTETHTAFGSASGLLLANTWYAVAVDKDPGGTIRLYIDGVMVAKETPADSSMRVVSTSLGIGLNTGNSHDYAGWIDELRITKGVARYGSDAGYTVSTTRFPRHLAAAGGSYAVSGTDATLTYEANAYTLAADAGNYALTGASVGFPLTAGAGSYSLTGTAATLTSSSTYTLAADAGNYALTGTSVDFGDPYFSSVVLLVHFTGANGSTSFFDESYTNRLLTAGGNAQIQSNKLELDGTDDNVTAADSNDWIRTGDFTMEVFGLELDALVSFISFLSQYNSTGSQRGWSWTTNSTGNLSLNVWTDGTSGSQTTLVSYASTILAVSTEYDICVERSGSTVRLYVDGEMVASASSSAVSHNSTAAFMIGGNADGSNDLNGRMAAVRMTNGVARYASDDGYSVPVLPLPTVGREELTVNFTGSNGSTTFTDISGRGRTLTAVGNAQIQSNKLELDGTGDYVTVPDNAAWTLSGLDFTLEIFGLVLDSLAASVIPLTHYNSASNQRGWLWNFVTTGAISFQSWADGVTMSDSVASAAGLISTGVSYDVAVTKKDGTVYLYVDGVQVASGTFDERTFDSTATLTIGATASGAGPVDGRLAAVRITRGAALYTGASYTVPSLPLT